MKLRFCCEVKSTSCRSRCCGSQAQQRKDRLRGAHRNIYQKATAFESAHGDQGRGNRRKDDGFHLSPGESPAALRRLPPPMPEGPRCTEGTGMARYVNAPGGVDAALSSSPG